MQYCMLGSLSSKAEDQGLVAAIKARQLPPRLVDRAGEYFVHLKALQKEGFAEVEDAWIPGAFPTLVIFTGRHKKEEPTTRGGQRLFVAIELDGRGRVGALIKLSWDYLGRPEQWADNCTDAVDRFLRGTRVS